jgi:DNA-binding response OmpR family regulator
VHWCAGRTGKRQNVLVAGDLELDPVAHQVKLAGNVLDIVGREYDLLHVLMRNTGRVLVARAN